MRGPTWVGLDRGFKLEAMLYGKTSTKYKVTGYIERDVVSVSSGEILFIRIFVIKKFHGINLCAILPPKQVLKFYMWGRGYKRTRSRSEGWNPSLPCCQGKM